MTTSEQLKIYSAYLPYELEGTFTDLPKGNSFRLTKIERDWDDGIEEIKLSGVPGPYGGHTTDAELFKPFLWDLTHLTKEIEHEGKAVTLSNILNKDYEWLIRNPELYKELSVFEYEIFLKYHFNVFDIPAGDFIEKSTLKTESNT